MVSVNPVPPGRAGRAQFPGVLARVAVSVLAPVLLATGRSVPIPVLPQAVLMPLVPQSCINQQEHATVAAIVRFRAPRPAYTFAAHPWAVLAIAIPLKSSAAQVVLPSNAM